VDHHQRSHLVLDVPKAQFSLGTLPLTFNRQYIETGIGEPMSKTGHFFRCAFAHSGSLRRVVPAVYVAECEQTPGIGCDAHKKFSAFVAVNEKGHVDEAFRVAHDRELYRDYVGRLPSRSVIALDACGHYSWLVDEMERVGHCPKLCNPRRFAMYAKVMRQ